MDKDKIRKLEDEKREISNELLSFEENMEVLRKKLREIEDSIEGNPHDNPEWNKVHDDFEKMKEKREHLSKKAEKLGMKVEKARQKFNTKQKESHK